MDNQANLLDICRAQWFRQNKDGEDAPTNEAAKD